MKTDEAINASDPVAEVLRKSFELAKQWSKSWTTETRKYDVGFGFVKGIGVYLLVKDKQTGERVFFKTQGTGLTAAEMSQAIRQYAIRFRDLTPMNDFANKKEGKKQKGVKRTWKRPAARGGKSDRHARRRKQVPGKEDENK